MRYLLSLLLLLAVSVTTAQDLPQTRTTPPDPNGFALEPIADGFQRALYVTHAGDDSGRLFVVQQNGIIYVFQNGVTLETPFLNISGYVSEDALGTAYTERGLLGLAFHPDYAENGLLYINYTERGTHETVVASLSVMADNPNMADFDTRTELLRIPQPYGNHNGGHMAFGADGYLYISVGDGGSAGDPLNSGQNPNTLLGTILRIDVDMPLFDNAYGIPLDNPFVGLDTGLDEVWAYGLRNVWRFSFDPLTGDMFIGDVGQNRWEEINILSPTGGGANFGWNVFEASHPYSGAAAPADVVMPIAEYQHINGHCSVTGGYVYYGETVAALRNSYVYGDFCSGQMWATYRTPEGTWQTQLLQDTPYLISSFGMDEAGELYVVHYGDQRQSGQILKLVSG
jgi:glucose/arabinose dehydrogenase